MALDAVNTASSTRNLQAPAGSDIDAFAMARVLDAARMETGRPLLDLLSESPVLLVFLRHAGCTFCREALADIADVRSAIEADGTRIVLVHMGDQAEIEAVVQRYGVQDLDRVSDPGQQLYRAFGLKQGNWWQLLGPKTWWRGLIAGWLRGHGVAKPVADASQMPGVFLIDKGMVISRYRHTSAADRRSYIEICELGRRDSE